MEWKGASDKAQAIVREELDRAHRQIRANITAAAAYSSGRTANSMRVSVDVDEQTVTGSISTSLPWFEAVEKGRKQYTGWTGQNGFKAAVIEWSQRSGLPRQFKTDKERESWARGYVYRVNKYGNRLYQNGGRDDLYTPVLKEAAQRITSRLTVKELLGAEVAKVLSILSFGKKLTL